MGRDELRLERVRRRRPMREHLDDPLQEETDGTPQVRRTSQLHHRAYRQAEHLGSGNRTRRVVGRIMQMTFQAMIFPTVALLATLIIRIVRYTGVS